MENGKLFTPYLPSIHQLKIILFYFQASQNNPDHTVVNMEGSLNLEDLTLEPMREMIKVRDIPGGHTAVDPSTQLDRKFKQGLRYDGKRLVLKTGPVLRKLNVSKNQYGKYVMISLSPWLRQQLNTIEEFVIQNISIPSPLSKNWKAQDANDTPYKRVWDGHCLCVPLSNWCSYFRQDENFLSEIEENQLGHGIYEINIEVIGVYFGSHKGNKLASLSIQVQSMLFKPKDGKGERTIERDYYEEGEAPPKNVKRRRKAKDEKSVSDSTL